MSSRLILPAHVFAQSQQAIGEGREICERIADMVNELKAKGIEVLEVRVNEHTADRMRAFFASWSDFDGVLPAQVRGVPFAIGGTGGRDLIIRHKRGATEH